MANPPHRNASLKEAWEGRKEGGGSQIVLQHPVLDDRRIKQPFFLKTNILCLQEVFSIPIFFQCFLVILHVKNFLIYSSFSVRL